MPKKCNKIWRISKARRNITNNIFKQTDLTPHFKKQMQRIHWRCFDLCKCCRTLRDKADKHLLCLKLQTSFSMKVFMSISHSQMLCGKFSAVMHRNVSYLLVIVPVTSAGKNEHRLQRHSILKMTKRRKQVFYNFQKYLWVHINLRTVLSSCT